MNEMTPITLNLQAPNVNVIVHAKEGDRAGRYMNASLVDGAKAFIPPQNAYFAVRYMKADGNGGLYDTMEDNVTPAVTLSGNIATIGIAEQALTVPGRVAMELNIYDGNATRISAFTFTMMVEETVMPDGNVESTEYFNILTHEIALALQASDVVQAVVDMTVEAEELPQGSAPTVEKEYDPDAGTLKLTFGMVNGVNGKTAYESAVDGGYTGTEAEFNVELAGLNAAATAAAASAAAAAQSKADVQALAETIAGNVGIDDDYTGSATTWSSNKIKASLDNEQEIVDHLYDSDDIYTLQGYIYTDGNFVENNSYKATDFIYIKGTKKILITNTWNGESSLAIAFYTENKIFISGINNVIGKVNVTSIPNNAVYIRCSTNVSVVDAKIVYNLPINDTIKNAETALTELEEKVDKKGFNQVIPKNTTFFENINYFIKQNAELVMDKFVDTNGKIQSSIGVTSLIIQVKPNTEYILFIPDNNRGVIAENSTNGFVLYSTYSTLYASGQAQAGYHFTTGQNGNFIFVYFYNGTYDYETKADGILMFEGNAIPSYKKPTIKKENLPQDIVNGSIRPFDGKNVLIFGDSITDCCNLTVNASKETTAYSWRNPSNSYVKDGVTVNYSMWPKILKDGFQFNEIRNYARSGASYKTSQRAEGEERQNLHYQIDVALNDLDNPHDIFEVDNFIPDIVIFALGTNDGTPNDTYSSAMSKTILEADNATIDTAATINALDETKFSESARKAFMRIKEAFPMAQIYCVLPIQRADNEVNVDSLNEILKQMAQRYGCIIVNGAFDSGITRDFNVWNALGTYLKDGLHPNEKGQNLMARMIYTSLKNNYIPLNWQGFNS